MWGFNKMINWENTLIYKWNICTASGVSPDSHDRDPGSTQSGSPPSGWWDQRSSRWCRGPTGPVLRWYCHRYSPRTGVSHTQGCNCFCYSGYAESSEIWNKAQTDQTSFFLGGFAPTSLASEAKVGSQSTSTHGRFPSGNKKDIILLWFKGYRYVRVERKNCREVQSPLVLHTQQPQNYSMSVEETDTFCHIDHLWCLAGCESISCMQSGSRWRTHTRGSFWA